MLFPDVFVGNRSVFSHNRYLFNKWGISRTKQRIGIKRNCSKYKYYNLFNTNKRKVPTNKEAHENIFTVQLKKLTNNFTFEANHIHEDCHFTLYGLSPE